MIMATRQIKLPLELNHDRFSLVHKPWMLYKLTGLLTMTDWSQKLTFSTFSTVKSRASGVAAILPGVSISPLTRSCQMIKEEQHIQKLAAAVELHFTDSAISKIFHRSNRSVKIS